MYADDIVLLSPSATGLSLLLHVCGKYGLEHDIRFKKSAVLIFRNSFVKDFSYPSFVMNGESIKEVPVVCMIAKCLTKWGRGGCGYYDVTAHIFLILSLTFTLNEEGVGEGLWGVLSRWVIVGVVGVRSRWVGGGDPLENWNLTSAGWWTGICGGWMI